VWRVGKNGWSNISINSLSVLAALSYFASPDPSYPSSWGAEAAMDQLRCFPLVEAEAGT